MAPLKCERCPLATEGISNCIGGRGDGRILLVGQNLGGEEDLAGSCFVGPSGKLLSAMLADAGIDESEVRFTNAVRCRTPENRAPWPNEVASCNTWLREEVATQRPDIIVALGDIPLSALCRTSGIGRKRGQPLPLHKTYAYPCEVWPTYHPAAVLRTPGLRSTVVGDLRNMRDRKLEQPEQPYIEWNGWNSTLKDATLLAYDIETYNQEGEPTDEATQMALATPNALPLVAIGTLLGQMMQLLREPGTREGFKLIGHFSWDFDDPKVGVKSDYDTAPMAYLLDETQPLGLEALSTKYLGVRGWKEDRGDAVLGSSELKVYNARDAVNTLGLYMELRRILESQKTRTGVARMNLFTHIIAPLHHALSAASTRGLYINIAAVDAAHTHQTAVIADARASVEDQAASILPVGAFDKQLKTKVRRVEFNPGSPLHIARVYNQLGYHLPLTPGGKQQCVDEETLQTFAPYEEFTTAILRWRGATKRMGTYIEPYQNIYHTRIDHRVNPSFTAGWRTLTGRTSCKVPNVQNIPREYKDFFTAETGGALVRADYQQLEFWAAVWLAGVDRLIERRRADPGFDPHTWFATKLYGRAEVTPEERQIAKSANFGLLYLGTEQTLIDYAVSFDIHLTYGQTREIVAAWRAAYPEFLPWWVSVRKQMNQGYVESPTGRRRNTGDVALLRGGGRLESAHREAVNALVQGFTTGDISEIGFIICHQRGLPVNDFIHDEIVCEFVTVQDAQQAVPKIRSSMIDGPVAYLKRHFNVDFPAHLLEVDIKVIPSVLSEQ